jgi:hypothetical protein
MSTGSDDPRNNGQNSRAELLALALRENLQRRKAQARARAAGEQSPDDPSPSHDSAGIVTDKPSP